MRTVTQLDPPIWLHTPKGEALAWFLVSEGMENDLEWVCVQADTGQIWTWTNPDVRAMKNITLHRTTEERLKPEPTSGLDVLLGRDPF